MLYVYGKKPRDKIILQYFVSNAALCAAQQNTDERETHERSSGSSKNQSAQDRRIDILPAEDEDGKCIIQKMILINN